MWSSEIIMQIDHSVVMYGTHKKTATFGLSIKIQEFFSFFSSWCEALQSCFDSRRSVQSPYLVNKLSLAQLCILKTIRLLNQLKWSTFLFPF